MTRIAPSGRYTVDAAAKALGTGLTDPKRFEVVAREGDRLRIGEREIETRREGDHIIAWTPR